MGTRSLTHIKTAGKTSPTLTTLYRQYDGYLEGMGVDLAKFITSKKLVNGYQDKDTQFNGVGCMAAQLIGHLKGGEAGGLYVYPVDSKDCDEEYTYTIWEENGEFYLECEGVYSGPAKGFEASLGLAEKEV